MKTNLTSLEIHYLVKELGFLVDGKVDNIYNPKKEEFVLQFHVPSKGKQILRIISGKLFYLASIKELAEEPSQFCMFLRKHLGNAKLRSIKQIESERIIEFMFEKEEKKKLIVEFFGKGNILLCDKDNIILSALVYHKWRDRDIRAKLKYDYPKMDYNFLKLELGDLKDLFNKSEKSLVKCLAAELGLGGTYSEEVCLLNGIDKNINPDKLGEKEIKGVLKSVNDMADNKTNPMIIYENEEAKDVVPFELKIYNNLKKKEVKNYNEAFDYYFLNHFKEEKPKTKKEMEIEKLIRRLEQQRKAIEGLEKQEAEERKKADLIYQNYSLIGEILKELKKATTKYSWKDIEVRLKGHKVIKSVNPKEKEIEIEV